MKRILLLIAYFNISLAIGQTQIILRDAVIDQMITEISAANLEQYVRDLADFRTRHTLSEDNTNEGILASQNYVLNHFKSFEQHSNGRDFPY